jgi:hypothetical protein
MLGGRYRLLCAHSFWPHWLGEVSLPEHRWGANSKRGTRSVRCSMALLEWAETAGARNSDLNCSSFLSFHNLFHAIHQCSTTCTSHSGATPVQCSLGTVTTCFIEYLCCYFCQLITIFFTGERSVDKRLITLLSTSVITPPALPLSFSVGFKGTRTCNRVRFLRPETVFFLLCAGSKSEVCQNWRHFFHGSIRSENQFFMKLL